MADILQLIKDYWLSGKYQQFGINGFPRVAQDRYSQAPVFFGNPGAGIGGKYFHNENAGNFLKNQLDLGPKLDSDTLRSLDNLVNQWRNTNGVILTDKNDSHYVAHEAVHNIYDKSGLKNNANQLSNLVPDSMKNILLNSYTYGKNPSPEMLSDEGLAFETTIATPESLPLIKKAVELIQDAKLKKSLIHIFNAKNPRLQPLK